MSLGLRRWSIQLNAIVFYGIWFTFGKIHFVAVEGPFSCAQLGVKSADEEPKKTTVSLVHHCCVENERIPLAV